MSGRSSAPRPIRPWRTLRGRLITGSILGLLVACLVFIPVSARLIQSTASDAARAELERQTRATGKLVSEQANEAARRGRPYRLRVPNLERLIGAEAVAYIQGSPINPGEAPLADMLPEDAAILIDFDGELVEKGAQRIDFTAENGRRLEGVAVPIIIDGQVFAALVIARPPSNFEPSFGRIASQTLIAALAGLAVALALSLYLTTRVTRPINALHAATRRVTEGRLGSELDMTGMPELDQVSQAFNRMVHELAERDALAREFLMKITHDLRTPVTAIRGHAAALADGVVPDEQVPRSLGAIEGEAARLETMVSDLLDLAKMDAHRFRLEFEETDPAEVLDQAFVVLENRAARRNITYEKHVGNLGSIITDPARVQQIANNLLDNALRWAPEGGTVRLEAHRRRGGGFVASIRDDGPGIPEAQLQAIFEPFYSAETPEGQKGSGLGLAISRQLARALGGDVLVESREGDGSLFTLELPERAAQV